MEPEETDPTLLVGRHVVEVGMRQVHPFLTFADHASGREVRLYVDAPLRVLPGARVFRQDDAGLLTALEGLNMLTVDGVEAVDGGLQLVLEDEGLWIDGEPNELTTNVPWWFGVQLPGSDPSARSAGPVVDPLRGLLGDDHLPAGFAYPGEFRWAVEHGLVDLEPWRVLQGEPLARKLLGLRKRYPAAPLVPFAARTDNDDVACWDTDLSPGRVVVIQDWASPGWERRGQFDDFASWFGRAVQDCLELSEFRP